MRPRRAVALGVAAWAVVAVAGAVLVWGVISRAGDGVSSGIEALPSAEPTGEPRNPSGSPDRSPTGSPASPRGTASPGTSPATSSPPSSTAPVARTWHDSAGAVSAECRGATIGLTGSTAYSGYSLEVDERGPDRVRVEFETEERRTRVEAECRDGVPVFSVARDD